MKTQPESNQENPSPSDDLIKVVDRQGKTKLIPRSQYESKKRSRKKRGSRKSVPYGRILSILLVVAIMVVAAYIALKIVQ